MSERIDTSIASLLERILKNRKAVAEPLKPGGPVCIARFSSKAQMDIWLFCSDFPYSLYDWAKKHEALHKRKPNADWLKIPEAIALNESGDLPIEYFRRINQGLLNEECRAGACRLCWGTGWAYVIRGVLLSDSTGIPGQLVSTRCWCRQREEEG